ncbi:hypothetical protein [Brevibacillus nitrificans]|uniref:hypothetical protein n=1 Tax=Brevibacillus nitrificans TaxID=651560 RepID=UPI0026258DDA|nr:hypothetical protein [Brevibacillus nitrificans]
MFKLGQKVKWSSQAQGRWKEKRGTLKMILEAEQDAVAHLPLGLPKSRFKGERYSENRRALVEVPRGGKSILSDYYAPRLSSLQLDESI